MGRRRRGLQYMISTKDKLLTDCYPSNITWNEYIKECEKALSISELHSDEYSTNDEELADEERNNKTRPERIIRTNSVIKIHDKQWRSTRVCKVVKLFLKNIKNITFIYNNLYIFLLD